MNRKKIYFYTVACCLAFWACEPVETQQSNSDSVSNAESAQQESPTETPPVKEDGDAGTIGSETQYPLPGAYAILYGNFGSQQDAEDNIRTLRALRINCYLHKTRDKQYGVLIGPYANHSQAEKQMFRLQEREIEDLSLYHLGNK